MLGLLSWRPFSGLGSAVAVETLLKAGVSIVSHIWPDGKGMGRASCSGSNTWGENSRRPQKSSTSECPVKRYAPYETGSDVSGETESPLEIDVAPSKESGERAGGLFASLVDAEERFHVLLHGQ